MSSTMLIDETPSSDGGIYVFSSVKTRPFSALSGDGFGLAHGAGKGQRFGPFAGIFLQTETAGKARESTGKACSNRGASRGLPIAYAALKIPRTATSRKNPCAKAPTHHGGPSAKPATR